MRHRIERRALVVFFLFASAAAAAPTGKWVEVRSPNFIVVSNAGEGQARKTAVQFEQVRSLFRDSLPYVKNSPSPVITVLAVKDENSLRDLLPEYWAEKGHTHPAGIFVSGPYEQFQVALNLGAGDNPLQTVYHEYYHSVTMPYFPDLPIWVAEGMADFFGNSQIGDKTALVGVPNADLIGELRNGPLIPLPVLFKVDQKSPYYNEQKRVSLFYAESWALIHYLMVGDKETHNAAFGKYLSALSQGASQEDAASQAFGDLRKLQDNLVSYIGRFSFLVFNFPAPPKIAENTLSARPLSEAEVDAYSGGFLALHRQYEPAEALLKQATQLDPKLALAQRNIGFLHYFRNERADALASFSAAVSLDSQDAITHFLRAQFTFDAGSHSDPQIEEDLRQALTLKPDFADADGLLAVYLAASEEKVPEALGLAEKAVQLQPGNLYFRLALAQVLVRARRYDDAEALSRRVLAQASDENIRTEVGNILTYLNQARDYDARMRQQQQEFAARAKAASAQQAQTASTPDPAPVPPAQPPADKAPSAAVSPADPKAPALKRRLAPNEVVGVVVQVHCDGSEMEITVKAGDRPAPLLFHAKDRTKVGYTGNACSELTGHTVDLSFGPAPAAWLDGELKQIAMEK